MPNRGVSVSSASPSDPDDGLEPRNELTDVEQELAHWRSLALQADERLRLALEVGRLGTWSWSIPDYQITREGYHEELFGLSPGGFSGTYEGFIACLHPDDREPVQAEVERCVALRQDYRQEYRVVWPDGSVHWIEGRARFQCATEDGQPIRMIGVVQEITERKLIEQHQARFQALFETAQDAVLISDSEYRYVDANAAAGELFGLEPDQLRGRRIEEFVEEVRGSNFGEAWQHFQAIGEQRGQCRLRRPDGTVREVEHSAKASFAPGLHLSILRDITDRNKAEEALARQASELARSNADLQQFAYVASHDLQEPLRTIISFSQMLAKRYADRLDADADEFLEYIVSGAHRMKGLVDSLLTYSRAVRTDATPFVSVSLDVAVDWATMNLAAVIDETHADVTHDPLPTVKADQVQIVQLFQNLISNAIKYRKPEEQPKIHLSAAQQSEAWVVSVRDNGIGMNSEYAERIFGVFKRLHGKEIPGSGIGLAICKRIVEKHHGRIWVESQPGQGSTFFFTIPLELSA